MHFSSILVGDETLTRECGRLILSTGNTVSAVITGSALVSEWAAGEGLRVLSHKDVTSSPIGAGTVDYLFSIANLRMLKPTLLQSARRGAINFHDGPLPRFAGLNAPVWAILHGETQYAVTWHLMTEAADEGDILRQESFSLDTAETAVSLNTRCFEAGLRSFELLLADLESETAHRSPQDFSQRTYFGLHDRPLAAGVIDFAAPAVENERLVRALSFGPYANPVGTAKLRTSNGVVVVGAVRSITPGSMAPAGSVLQITDNEILVATSAGDIALSDFSSLDGTELTTQDTCTLLHVSRGSVIASPGTTEADALSLLARASAESESAALELFEREQSLTLPLLRPVQSSSGMRTMAEANLFELDPALAVRTLATLAATSCGQAATVSVATSERIEATRQALDVFTPWFPAEAEPLTAAKASGATRSANRAITSAALARDLRARSPMLRGKPATGDRLGIAFGAPATTGPEVFSLLLEVDPSTRAATWRYDGERFSETDVAAFARAFHALAEKLSETVDGQPLALLDPAQQNQLAAWNATERAYAHESTLAHAFMEAVSRTPDSIAVIAGDVRLSYADLDGRACALATHLRNVGVVRGSLVAINLDRSIEMVVAVLAIHKAGGAYVPVDPAYPEARKQLMVEDSGASVIITTRASQRLFAGTQATFVFADEPIAPVIEGSAPLEARADDLAYVIYTSGSTGKPKGVMLEHRNVLNFFAGMDDRLGTDPSAWLAVTSLSFDISVLELLWTLTRNFTVVLNGVKAESPANTPSFSLFFFSSSAADGQNAYQLLMDASRFADQRGFEAVWTPERHFHAFGGAFPNPAVIGAALAAATTNVQIRAGSCVLPLHSPIRVAEEWAVVDNLSGGRVGVSFAAGWQPDDFVLRPESFADAKAVMEREIPIVQALWRGESRDFPGPNGRTVAVSTLPRPVQRELPTWITSAGDPETFRAAGRLGTNILTHLLGQPVEDLDAKISAYREAWRAAGHAGKGQVTLMLHTYIGEDTDAVRELVREPMIAYLRSSVGLIKQFASSFPAFKRLPAGEDAGDLLASLPEEDMRALLEIAFERYYETSGLFGHPQRAAEMVARVKAAGVDELACLVDFGLDSAEVMRGLEALTAFKDSLATEPTEDRSASDLILEHGVTHLQCTPSMAAMLLADSTAKDAFAQLDLLMVGGEALPVDMARELASLVRGRVVNMYGPTETTIWSTTHEVDPADASVPIGRPIANTTIYILGPGREMLPPGFVGELWIGGDGVARGYLGRPELTAERFLPDPFTDKPGARMYRTGDLARFRGDGVVEFLGRVDQQVKVRGYRIEPGEIESLLRAQPGIDEAVVVAREIGAGDYRLIGYYVAAEASDPGPDILRKALGEALPDYMVPTNFVRLASMPLTPNAKIDRNALPDPMTTTPPREQVAHRPASQALTTSQPDAARIEMVSGVWESVLRVENVNRERSFFEVGGNSLLLLQVHKRLREHHPELRLTDLFKYPTINALAVHLTDNGSSTGKDQDALSRAAARRAAMGRRSVRA